MQDGCGEIWENTTVSQSSDNHGKCISRKVILTSLVTKNDYSSPVLKK